MISYCLFLVNITAEYNADQNKFYWDSLDQLKKNKRIKEYVIGPNFIVYNKKLSSKRTVFRKYILNLNYTEE